MTASRAEPPSWAIYLNFSGPLCWLREISTRALPSDTPDDHRSIHGYGLAARMAMAALNDAIAGAPELLGLPPDQNPWEADHFGIEKFMPNPGASCLQSVQANLAMLARRLESAANRIQFDEACLETHAYLDLMSRAHDASVDVRLGLPDAQQAFAAHFAAANFDAGQDERWWMRKARERHDPVKGYENPAPISLNDETKETWLRGAVEAARQFVHEQHFTARPESVDGLRPPPGFRIGLRGELPLRLALPLVSQLAPSKGNASFASWFIQRPVRMIANRNSHQGVHFFLTVLKGRVVDAKRNKEPADVVRIMHPVGPGHDYSYGIYMPSGGTLSNSSEFWLAYRVATDYSGTGGSAHTMIEAALAENFRHVRVQQHVVPEGQEGDLQRFLESKPLAILANRARRYGTYIADLRGSLSELAVAELLRRMDYEILGVRAKVRCLGKEVDVIARNNTEVILAEVKASTSAIPVDEWIPGKGSRPLPPDVDTAMQDLLDFDDKASRASSPEILRELKTPNAALRFLAVTTGTTTGQPARFLKLVEYWDEARFHALARKHGLPSAYYRQLDTLREVDAESRDHPDIDRLEDTLIDPEVAGFR